MWRIVLVNKDNHAFHSERVQTHRALSEENNETLVAMSPLLVHGVFKAVTLSGAATTIIASPKPNGSLILTDLVISAKKVAGTTLTIEFDDGANTEVIVSPDTINQSVNFSWSPVGRLQGWRGAALKVTTVGANTDATVTAGYVKNPESLVYADWDALR